MSQSNLQRSLSHSSSFTGSPPGARESLPFTHPSALPHATTSSSSQSSLPSILETLPFTRLSPLPHAISYIGSHSSLPSMLESLPSTSLSTTPHTSSSISSPYSDYRLSSVSSSNSSLYEYNHFVQPIQYGQTFVHEYWLPEFRPPTPPAREEEVVDWAALVENYGAPARGRWIKKTQRVEMKEIQREVPGFINIELNRLLTRTEGDRNIPTSFCQCAVCYLVHIASVSSPSVFKNLVRKIVVVEHGIHHFTIYDKMRPWSRMRVTTCTNPQPLARRMPPLTTGSADLNAVYSRRMYHQGKVIHNPNKRKN